MNGLADRGTIRSFGTIEERGIRMAISRNRRSKAVSLASTALVLSGLGAAVPQAASAQAVTPFTEIEDRSRSEYSQPPIVAGGFEIYPQVETLVDFVDNLYVTELAQVDDVAVSVMPRVDVRSRRPDRDIFLRAQVGYETYLDNQAEDRLTFLIRGRGRFGLGTLTRPFVGFQVNRNNSSSRELMDFRYSAQPLTVTTLRANAGLERDFGPITGVVEGTFQSADYGGAVVIGGVALDGGFRDFKVYGGRAQLGYSRFAGQRVYIQFAANRRDFSGAASDPRLPADFLRDRSSEGFQLEAGYAASLTELLQVDIRAGYLRQEFDDPAVPVTKGLSFEGQLLWSPTALTTVSVRGSRSIDNTDNPLFSGVLRSELSAGIQHELRRNVILSADARYSRYNPAGSGNNGSEWQMSAAARYLISPRWSLSLRGERFERNNTFAASQNRLSLSVRFSY